MRNPGYTLESVDNALKVILTLQAEGSVRLAEVATELGVARSTAHRLLATLVKRGFAVQDASRRYLPGPALMASVGATSTSPITTTRARTHSFIQDLSKRTGETAHLMVREGTKVRFLDSVEGPQALKIGSRIGVTLPAHVTSGGKALLAQLDRRELTGLYGADEDAPDIPSLLRQLRSVRQRGYGTNIGESERGVTAIGVRIGGVDKYSAVAVTISAPSLRLPRGRISQMADLLLDSTRKFESELARDVE